MPVTILDIAKASGKSFPTVSRALNNHPKISAKTKQAIWAIAGELGYKPSFAGKVLKNGFTRILSVIVPDLGDPFYAEFIRAFKTAGAADGYDVVVYDYEMKRELELRYLEMMLSGCCDGVVAFITSFEHTASAVKRLWSARIPLVAVGTPDDASLNYDLVTIDASSALEQICRELYDGGKRNMAFVVGMMSDAIFAQVREHVASTFGAIPLRFNRDTDLYRSRENGCCQAEDGLRIGRELFARDSGIDVIMAWHGEQAYGLMRAAFETGKRIPEDVAIIVRDNTWVTKYAVSPIHAIDQRLEVLAQEAFEMIVKRLQDKEWCQPFRQTVMARRA